MISQTLTAHAFVAIHKRDRGRANRECISPDGLPRAGAGRSEARRESLWGQAVLDLPALVSPPSGSLAGLIAAAGRFGGDAGGWHQVRMVLHRNSGQRKERR